MIPLLLIVLQTLQVEVFRFEAGYVEVWYQLPISALVDSQDLVAGDTICATYSYTFAIHNNDGTDSAFVEGRKSVDVYKEDWEDFIIDHLSLDLYPGRFNYDFDVHVKTYDLHDMGVIEVSAEAASFACSDLVLGKWGLGQFRFHGVAMLPSVNAAFTPADRLFSYLELYGLVPDSLYYLVEYKIHDHTGAVLLHDKRELVKYDYAQIDTHVVDLSRLVSGMYEYTIEIGDPSSASSVARSSSFTIVASDDAAGRKFYHEIQYIISSDEYKKFRNLSDVQQEVYLKEFWSLHDYRQFEQRIAEADKRFSTSDLLGRDSERGRLYVMLGPPDEIETMSVENWARPFEVWYYYGRNDFLFSDIRSDHNPRLIKILKPGELTDILNAGIREGSRDEEWLSDIAPGTYDWHEDKTSPE
ncbi:MAG: GWxTD domain-containing protein [bacterium]